MVLYIWRRGEGRTHRRVNNTGCVRIDSYVVRRELGGLWANVRSLGDSLCTRVLLTSRLGESTYKEFAG